MFVSKKWGYEIWVENNELYCGKHLHVVPEHWCSVHWHKDKKETFYILEGELLLHYAYSIDKEVWDKMEYEVKVLKKGMSFTIRPGVTHRFTSNTAYPCNFMEISTEHKDSDSYRIIEST